MISVILEDGNDGFLLLGELGGWTGLTSLS